MSALSTLWVIYFLIVASAVMGGLAILASLAWLLLKAWAWFVAWRAERQLTAEIRSRRAWRALKRGMHEACRRGWLPEDMQ